MEGTFGVIEGAFEALGRNKLYPKVVYLTSFSRFFKFFVSFLDICIVRYIECIVCYFETFSHCVKLFGFKAARMSINICVSICICMCVYLRTYTRVVPKVSGLTRKFWA